jgi:uncharacterized protein (TIGR00255 family)
MKSMTGYGHSEYKDEKKQVVVELKSYNHRYLDIFVSVPSYLGPLEPRIREFVASRIERGKVEVYLKLREYEEELTVYVDRQAARNYLAELKGLKKATGVRGKPRLSHLLRMEGVLKTEKEVDVESLWQVVEPLLEKSFQEFDTSRQVEGEKTEKDILSHMDAIETGLAAIEEKSDYLEEKIQDDLRERFQQLLGEGVDENRVYSETAVLLVRYNINEELQRIKSHLSRFRTLASEERVVGKKLDFVAQELNREINTIGSKSVLVEINQTVIDIKNSIEKVREQLRNVE